jgi:glycerol-3-phosphate dehydrogenase (NAD(P)+)
MTRATVAVLGAGAWGVALANVAAQGRARAPLWAHDPRTAQALARDRENKRRLPGLPLAAAVAPTDDISIVREAEIILAVTPAQAIRMTARAARPHLREGAAFVICAKGIERERGRFLSEVVREELPQASVAVLSGPSFAADVCRGLPTAVTLAAHDEQLARHLCEELSTKTFRLYRSTDVRGVEIGGAAKNVLAIAAGMSHGRGLGASAQAALIARGFAELMRLGRALGARQETLMGLSGLGDLVLTCGSAQSRNFALGEALGRGESLEDATHGKLAEGAFTARVMVEMARAHDVELPIAEAVDAILSARLSIDGAVEALLMRPLKAED